MGTPTAIRLTRRVAEGGGGKATDGIVEGARVGVLEVLGLSSALCSWFLLWYSSRIS